MGGGGAFFVCLFFNPMGSSWLLRKCIIFYRRQSFSKMQYVQMGSVGMKKMFLCIEEGCPEKNELYECHGGGTD